MNDLEDATEICELCDNPNIRYQFLIRNINNFNELFVGSECITKFNILTIDADGNILNDMSSREKVKKDRHKLISDSKEKNVINSLLQLSKLDEKFEIENFIKFYRDGKSFTPNQLSLLIWRLDENKIPYNKSNFKMTIKRSREKEQLKEMAEWKIDKILQCMTTSNKIK